MFDQRNKRINLANKIIDNASSFIDSLQELNSLSDEYSKSGLGFQDTDFDTTQGLQHLVAQDILNILTNSVTLKAYSDAQFITGIFEKAKR